MYFKIGSKQFSHTLWDDFKIRFTHKRFDVFIKNASTNYFKYTIFIVLCMYTYYLYINHYVFRV